MIKWLDKQWNSKLFKRVGRFFWLTTICHSFFWPLSICLKIYYSYKKNRIKRNETKQKNRLVGFRVLYAFIGAVVANNLCINWGQTSWEATNSSRTTVQKISSKSGKIRIEHGFSQHSIFKCMYLHLSSVKSGKNNVNIWFVSKYINWKSTAIRVCLYGWFARF